MDQMLLDKVHEVFPNYRVIDMDDSYLVRRDIRFKDGSMFAVILHKEGVFIFKSLDGNPLKAYADSEEFDRRFDEYTTAKGEVLCLVNHEGFCDQDLVREIMDAETFYNVVLRDYEVFMEAISA